MGYVKESGRVGAGRVYVVIVAFASDAAQIVVQGFILSERGRMAMWSGRVVGKRVGGLF